MYQNQYTNLIDIFANLEVDSLTASVYEFFLINPELTISNCAKQLKLHRHQVYSALEKLQAIGMLKSQVKSIIVEPPETLIILLEYKSIKLSSTARNLETLIPKLKGDMSNRDNSFVKTYFRKTQLLEVVQNSIELMNKHETALIFGESEDFYKLIEAQYLVKTIVQKRVKKQIKAKILLVGPVKKETMKWLEFDEVELRESKILNEGSNLVGAFWVCGSKVILWNTEKSIAITIEDEFYSRMFSSYFELVWKGN
jgi:sugar-specific transcriptional regulator TrmB